MNQINLPLDKALRMQSKGQITLVDASPNQLEVIDHTDGVLWKDNFQQLLFKASHVSPDKIASFFNAKYRVCISSTVTEGENEVYIWRYLHGIENTSIQNKTADNVEYIYVLTNDHYKGMVKIGMTTDTVKKRVGSINNSGVLDEWQPVFALAVKKGSAYKVEQAIHKFFADVRVDSSGGSSREFFKLTPFQAFDKVREVGAIFQVGEPIYFN
jgi:hypothetical protein